jgi:AcrR family transcriptional regulator
MDETRRELLKAAYHEIHRQGFQAASLSAILEHTGVTKGALYHYFDSKQSLGYAVFDELIRPFLQKTWIEPLKEPSLPPLERFKQTIIQAADDFDDNDIRLGCPLNNLAQEMSPIDEGFRTRIDSFYREWLGGITSILNEGQTSGTIRGGIDPGETALFIIASMEGCMSMAKNAQSRVALFKCGKGLLSYLDNLSIRS